MSYAALHAYCQQLAIPISRKKLYPKIRELCEIDKFRVCKTGMCVDDILGFFVSPGSDIAALPNWTPEVPVVVISRSLNHCWERFVTIKELMHLFDGELEKVGAGEELESLITEMVGPQPDRSIAMLSEIRAFWRAMGIMCPEGKRQEFRRMRDAGKITNLEIATQLLMPELHVPSLFDQNYKAIISSVMA